MQRLHDAQTAFLHGSASAEQLHLLELERAGEDMKAQASEAKKRKKEAGVLARAMSFLGMDTGNLGREEKPLVLSADAFKRASERTRSEGRPVERSTDRAREAADEGWVTGEVGIDEKGRPVPVRKAVKSVSQALEDARRKGEEGIVDQTPYGGGMLDQLAQNLAGTLTPRGRS